jgi:hypothetical protein
MFSGVKKAVKRIVKGVGKAFKAVGGAAKEFLGSKLGKVFMIAVAVWLGGAAIGLWESGFASIDGALVASQSLGATAPAAGEAAVAGAGTAGVESAAATATGGMMGTAPAAAAPFSAPAASTVAGVGTGGAPAAVAQGLGGFASAPEVSAFSLAPSAAPSLGSVGLTAPASALTPTTTGAGFMKTAGTVMKGAAKWMAENPIPTLLGGQMLANAMQPNAIDVAEDEQKRRQEEIDASNARLSQVGNIPTWNFSGAQLPLPQPPVTTPAGIMGRRLV